MLNGLIVFVCALLVILLAVKFGVLEIAAIVLAIVALIPFAAAVVLYFSNVPQINYQIANKAVTKADGTTYYDFWVGLMCEKGRVLLRDALLTSEFEVNPVKPPNTTGEVQYVGVVEEGGFAMAARLLSQPLGAFGLDSPMYPKHGRMFVIRLQGKEPRDSVRVQLFVDVMTDPVKQGVLAVFRADYTYRLYADVEVDFRNSERQDGYLSRRW